MTENNKWTRFLPSKIERWIRGDDEDAHAGAPDDAPADPLLSFQPPGVEWSPDGELPSGPVCPVCGTEYPEGASPETACPKCGAERPDLGLPAGLAPSPTRVLNVESGYQPRRACTACGGEVDIDGYCMTCGAKQESERDHYREEPARWLAGVCDRGIRHLRNEDAMALAASQQQGERGVLVVCDGVSTSVDSDVASLAGAQAARDVLSGNQPKGIGTPESRTAAMTQALSEACHAANTAVIAKTALDSANAASATFAAAVVSEGRIFYANLGDSRVYWFPDAGDGVQLSIDDSVAQAQIEAGLSREEAENSPDAHAITKWLGRDSADTEPRVGELDPSGPGWLLVCSDGIWNYASLPADLRTVLTEAITADPKPTSIVDIAEAMVAWSNQQGGRDNITVALARLGDLDMLAPAVEAPAAPQAVPVLEPEAPVDALVFEQPDWAGAPPVEEPLATSEELAPPLSQGAPPRPTADTPTAPEGAGPVTEATQTTPDAIVDTPPAN